MRPNHDFQSYETQPSTFALAFACRCQPRPLSGSGPRWRNRRPRCGKLPWDAGRTIEAIGPRPAFADLAYANESPAEKLDLNLPPPSTAPAPLVIWIHGGGFMVGDKRSMPRQDFGPAPKPTSTMGPYQIQVPDVAELTAKGYAVVSLNYRLGASMFDATYPALTVLPESRADASPDRPQETAGHGRGLGARQERPITLCTTYVAIRILFWILFQDGCMAGMLSVVVSPANRVLRRPTAAKETPGIWFGRLPGVFLLLQRPEIVGDPIDVFISQNALPRRHV